jgi:predicted TIM-barrel fold metal-dependent hydrolase
VARDPARLLGFGAVDPSDESAIDELVRMKGDLGLVGCTLGPIYEEVEPAEIETNIVLVDVSGTELYPHEFIELLTARGVLAMERDASRVRFVTHRLIGDAEIAEVAEIVAALAAEHVQTA